MSTANGLLENAIIKFKNLFLGVVFWIRDFYKCEWNRTSCSNHLLLGTLFLNYIKSN